LVMKLKIGMRRNFPWDAVSNLRRDPRRVLGAHPEP
jgi:hypothetical protein